MAGLGLGRDFSINKRFSVGPEIEARNFYLRNRWNAATNLYFELNGHYRMVRGVGISLGPTVSVIKTASKSAHEILNDVIYKALSAIIEKQYQVWLGLQMGLSSSEWIYCWRFWINCKKFRSSCGSITSKGSIEFAGENLHPLKCQSC